MEVENLNYKLYMPNQYINSYYQYYLDNNYILVRTNNNCYTQYSTTYCDCFRVFPNYNYVKSDIYSCSGGSYYVNSNQLSNDIFQLPNVSNIFITYFIIIFILVYILRLLWGVFRKRCK